jgi:DNA adenine methylase Dam
MINPPLNYTGSKFKLLEQLLPLFDYTKNYFIDLFCGGGSVYCNVLDKYERILINDKIPELIEIHKNLIHNPDEFVQKTKSYCPKKDDPEAYDLLRKDFNNEKTPEKLLALMLSCTNNMLRFNQKFLFNQTFGKRSWNDNTQIKVDEFVKHTQNYKDKIYFSSKDFFEIIPKKASMVYADPPYTNTDAGYNCFWNQTLEDKLYQYLLDLDKNGSSFMLSGVLGKHTKEKESKIINKLIEDGYKWKILDHNYNKVSRQKEEKVSQEVVIYNF